MEINIVTSMDPNDKAGSGGVGSERYVTGAEPLFYAIFFENLETASASAQEVVITDQLDASVMDLSTFSLGSIGFGSKFAVPLPESSDFSTEIDLRPAADIIVRISAWLDNDTGLLTWRLTSIDPETGVIPEDPMEGFLPPNVNSPEGAGSVSFVMSVKKNLPTGTEVANKASIVFDNNESIETSVWVNTIDNEKPSSRVKSLPAIQNEQTFIVQWSGSDSGSGIQSYAIYVSENDGDFHEWQTATTDTSATFTGDVGSTYSFYSVATDRLGQVEEIPDAPDATTRVDTDNGGMDDDEANACGC